MCTGSSEVRHQLEVPEFIGAKQAFFFLCFPATPCFYLFQPYKKPRPFELITSVIQYNRNGRKENGDEICSLQFGFQLVSKQSKSSPILKNTRVDSEWQIIAEWTESA